MTNSTPQEKTQKATATPTGGASPTKKARVAKRRVHVARSKAKSTRKATGAAKRAGTALPGTKTAKIIELLKRPGGVTLKDLLKVTGWQPHSIRGFLSGTIVKKMGTPVESVKSSDGGRTYRISSK